MLFRRRKSVTKTEKLRELLWPRKGHVRTLRYFGMRVLRLTASPHAVAAGVASGIMSSWTPFIGVHFFLSFAIAYVLAGDMLAAGLATAFGNPVTFPFIWATTWEIGNLMLGNSVAAGGQKIDLADLFEKMQISQLWAPIIKPMLVGAIPPAIVSGLLVYALTFFAVRGFQARRRIRLAEKARLRLHQAVDGISTV